MTVKKRTKKEHYLNTGNADSPTWSKAGAGFVEFTEIKNPLLNKKRYMHEKTPRTFVEGYVPTLVYRFEVCGDEPAVALIRRITEDECVGEDAVIEVISADLLDESRISGVFGAVKQRYSVVAGKCGEGTGDLYYTGQLVPCGEAEYGSFVRSARIFIKK